MFQCQRLCLQEFFAPFLRAIAGILVESKAGRCARAGSGRAFAIAREKGEVMKDREGVDSARYMGKMLARAVRAINKSPKD